MEKEWNVLVVSPLLAHRNYLLQAFRHLLSLNSFVVTTNQQARELLSSISFDVVFCDENTADGSYRELLSLALAQDKPRFIVILSEEEGQGYLEAIRLGAIKVLACPLQLSDIDAVLLDALRADSEQTHL